MEFKSPVLLAEESSNIASVGYFLDINPIHLLSGLLAMVGWSKDKQLDANSTFEGCFGSGDGLAEVSRRLE